MCDELSNYSFYYRFSYTKPTCFAHFGRLRCTSLLGFRAKMTMYRQVNFCPCIEHKYK